MKLFDTHTHFDLILDKERGEISRERLQELWQRSQQADVVRAVHIGIDEKSNHQAVRIAAALPGVYYSAGYHPSHDMLQIEEIRRIHETARAQRADPRFVAIGEVGLDYYWIKDRDERVRQQEVFAGFLDLARDLEKTVIIHCRDGQDHDSDALADCYRILSNAANLPRTIMHCFSGDSRQTRRFQKLGCFISFAGNVTFPKAVNLHEAALATDRDRILIETDAPYLTPVPFRGQGNDPSYLPHTLKFLASRLQEDEEKLAERIYQNSVQAFGVHDE